MTDEEALKALFPKPIRKRIEKELGEEPTEKPKDSRGRPSIKKKDS